ncbi:hypothetical protein EDB19DRAFT_1921270 [Suillus lakei]|nr:hypothetical protein EDB19DRAFT_1921270 [Suillus lakei]
MSTTNAPYHTRPSNATTRPGQIVLDAQVKRCTKVQKNANDLALKETKEAKEVQIQKELEHLADMQNEMEQVQEELLTKKVVPFGLSQGLIRQQSLYHQEAVKNLDGEAAGAKKKRAIKKGRKPLIRDAISNMQSKISLEASSKVEGDNAMIHVSDGKDTPTPHINASTQKFTLAYLDAQILIRKPVAPAQIPDAEVLTGSFADDDIDDTLECDATIVQGKGKSKVASIFDTNLDFDKLIAPVVAPFTQVENPLKWKAYVNELSDNDEESMVSNWSMDIEGPDLEDAIVNSDDNDDNALEPEPVVVKKEKVQHTTSLKKVKAKPSTACAHGAPTIKHQLNMDTTPEHMKPHCTYCNVDLPATMQVDQHWTKKYLSMVMLWAGSYDDI